MSTGHTHKPHPLTVVMGIFCDVVYVLRIVVRFTLQGSKVSSGTTRSYSDKNTHN